MDLLGRARRLESTIAAKLDGAAKGLVRSRPREPLEIVLAILDDVEQRIEPTGRGSRVFPFNRIELSVVAPSREARGRLEAVFAGDTPLRTRILERVQSAGCSAADVVVEIQYVDRADRTGAHPNSICSSHASPGLRPRARRPSRSPDRSRSGWCAASWNDGRIH